MMIEKKQCKHCKEIFYRSGETNFTWNIKVYCDGQCKTMYHSRLRVQKKNHGKTIHTNYTYSITLLRLKVDVSLIFSHHYIQYIHNKNYWILYYNMFVR